VPTSSYLTDDYFGLLDESEGLYCNGNLDIGIGRFPVRTLQHAKDAVEKIERYASKKNLAPGNKDPETGRNAISNYADWRNWICFIGDDKDNNLHLTQADMLATKVDTSNRQYDVDKIYFDAYKEYSTPGGQRYPDVTAAINQRVEKGALIVNYTGHGGEVGWSHERVLEISDINKWGNKYNMPVFTTATCEFSRLDDPERISAGELVFLNPNGGGIALFTTTRLSFANSNFALNDSFYNYVFKKKNGKYPKMGDIIRQSKVANGSNQYIRNFVLLGDPAMELAYPEYNVVTTEINGKKVTEGKPDTLKALTEIKIKGMIADDNGNKLPGFTGIVYPGIYDKAVSITTLGNDAESLPVRTFTLQKNIIYKGMARVSKGEFEFSFIVPKDIAYKYGKGKISYYAAGTIDSTAKEYTDANGCYEGIIIGGSGDTASADTKGPQIKLYMDNTSFVSGGRTGTNPLLLAYIKDESGINTTGNGIGHDITAVLDNNTENTIVLNDYYETDADKYTSGKINYYFSDLSAGKHTLRLKVWDVYNNSSEAGITFYVENSYKIFCYPNPLVYYSGVKQTTNLCFEHNYSLKDVNVRLKIEVSDMLGRKVKSIDKTVSDGVEYEQNVYRSVYEWDGLDDNNERLKPGIYLFRLTATNSSGLNASGGGKIRIKY
jgi:hypothetical protein